MSKTQKKIWIASMVIILILAALGLSGCPSFNDNIAKPFTQEEIAAFLEAKYDEEFVVGNIVATEDRRSAFVRRVYSAHPKDKPELVFHIVDKTIMGEQIKTWDRALTDTYAHALLKADFDKITSICDRLSITVPTPQELMSFYYNHEANGIYLSLSTDFGLEDIEAIEQQLNEVSSFFSDNSQKYRLSNDLVHVKLRIDNSIEERASRDTLIYLFMGEPVVGTRFVYIYSDKDTTGVLEYIDSVLTEAANK